VPVHTHVYYEDQKKEKKEKENRTLNERTDKRTNERNILNITTHSVTYSLCDYEERTSLCDLSFFFSSYVFSGLLHVFLSLYAESCGTRKAGKRRKKGEKKAKRCAMRCDAMHLFNIERKREERFFFVPLDRKKSSQGKRVVGEQERERERNGKARALITSLNGSLARSRCHCRRSWVPAAHKTRMRMRRRR
jgi:hypothetical protein